MKDPVFKDALFATGWLLFIFSLGVMWIADSHKCGNHKHILENHKHNGMYGRVLYDK